MPPKKCLYVPVVYLLVCLSPGSSKSLRSSVKYQSCFQQNRIPQRKEVNPFTSRKLGINWRRTAKCGVCKLQSDCCRQTLSVVSNKETAVAPERQLFAGVELRSRWENKKTTVCSVKIGEGCLWGKEMCRGFIVVQDTEHEGTVRKGMVQRKSQAEIKSTGQRVQESTRSLSKDSRALLRELRSTKDWMNLKRSLKAPSNTEKATTIDKVTKATLKYWLSQQRLFH